MPSSKQLHYDHPAYQTPAVYSSGIAAGANGVTQKFAAFTALQVRRMIIGPNVASTSATTPLMYVKSGTATSTTTFTAVGSAATAAVENVLATAVTLAAGDQFWVTHGTDATIASSVAIETYPVPGAALACP
jgi:Zn-dependent membrane protease YugP